MDRETERHREVGKGKGEEGEKRESVSGETEKGERVN